MNKSLSSEAKAFREVAGVLPSRIWWTGACALWSGLRKREKAMVLLGVILPPWSSWQSLGARRGDEGGQPLMAVSFYLVSEQ